jgi:hypothetical protein
MVWATVWAIFSQKHPVTLAAGWIAFGFYGSGLVLHRDSHSNHISRKNAISGIES